MALKTRSRILLGVSACFVAVCLLVITLVFGSSLRNEEVVSLYVRPGDTNDTVLMHLQRIGETPKTGRLHFLMKRLGYKEPLPVGHYLIEPGLSDFSLVRRLKAGLQSPVKLTFNNVRNMEQLAARLSVQLMADSTALLAALTDTAWIRAEGFNQETYRCIYLPNTYEAWWNASPEKVRAMLLREYRKFWDETRVKAASRHNLSPIEAQILASIVEEETNKGDEMSKVAGLYLNRLRIEMPLQADPTLKYAAGNPGIRRLTKHQIAINSPYNTYKNNGLPPGPIRITSIRAIEAVLNAERHSYLYMCAKADFSGYHAFATTYAQHMKNASAYHKALNERGILE
jgi:UPF0755 protein